MHQSQRRWGSARDCYKRSHGGRANGWPESFPLGCRTLAVQAVITGIGPPEVITVGTVADCQALYSEVSTHATNLVTAHRLLGDAVPDPQDPNYTAARRGRRVGEVSLNRGIVVMTVAAWQAYVEELARTLFEAIRPPANDPSYAAYRVHRAQGLSRLGRFNTPNAYNTRQLLLEAGFDVNGYWTWTVGREHLTVSDVQSRLDDWLAVRHRIAHGADLPSVDILASRSDGTRTLHLRNAEACIRFFERLVLCTSDGARTEFSIQ